MNKTKLNTKLSIPYCAINNISNRPSIIKDESFVFIIV